MFFFSPGGNATFASYPEEVLVSDDNSKRLTIYDLAQLAQSSPSTVSAVLNGTWQQRRISHKLADRILALAHAEGYSINMQARALRRERSGIVGMIVPMYDNRYFSSIAQAFEAEARRRGLFTIVSCTNRDPEQEREAARMMLAYRVEHLVCTGATAPDAIAEMCAAAGVPCLNLDLPGTRAPSVISANREGALRLTLAILDRLAAAGKPEQPVLFIGGRGEDHNTRERVMGFRQARRSRGLDTSDTDVLICGYEADRAQVAFQDYVERLGGPPGALFINSTISLEGIVRWLRLRGYDLDAIVLGCFDWDPLAAAFHPRLMMARQDVPAMIERVFELIDEPAKARNRRVEVLPTLIGV
ncbi:substrate-binding domain-containing protein [Halotalea alkalilenta]|uniref:substrate-binding domain-containing protein n=1 Tax=Halotalea alkalilenta TaxID=376489 RepID=UPI001B7FF807|nr:substrate-binding domain-containing protein [Halotalea alkalilenta]